MKDYLGREHLQGCHFDCRIPDCGCAGDCNCPAIVSNTAARTKPVEVWRTNAGAHLFNGITSMDLLSPSTGHPMLFSKRLELTMRVIELILEEGFIPKDMTQRVKGD